MNQFELELRTHFDEFFENRFFFLGHNRHTHGNVSAAGGGNVGFENIFLRETFPQVFNGEIAVFVEILVNFFLVGGIGGEFQNEFRAAVQVDTAPDGTGGVLADQGQHVAVVGDFLVFHRCGFQELLNGNAFVDGGIFQRDGVVHRRVLGFFCLGGGDQFRYFRALGIVADVFEGLIEIPFLKRVHGVDEYAQHQQSEYRTQNNGFLVHFAASSPAGAALTALLMISMRVLSAIFTMKVFSLTVMTSP